MKLILITCRIIIVFFLFKLQPVIAQVKINTADYDIYIYDTLLLDPSQLEVLPKLDKSIQKTMTCKIKTDGFKVYHYVSGFKFCEGSVKNKKREGEWISWYDSGKISNKVNYINGMKEGICTYWYKNDHLNATGQYENDLKEGDWLFYNPDGSFKGKFVYSKGLLIK